jgi:uncharacterized membrane protein YgaE (UPF0421/DUF939 family)
MLGITKILVALLLIAMTIMLTISFNLIGFLIGVGITIVLNGTFNRIDRRREKQP